MRAGGMHHGPWAETVMSQSRPRQLAPSCAWELFVFISTDTATSLRGSQRACHVKTQNRVT